MKLSHLPYHTIVMLTGLLLLLGLSIARLIKSQPGVKRTAGWLGLATVSWLLFFFSEVKFLGGTVVVMMIALLVSVISLLLTLREPGVLPGGRIFILLVALCLAAGTSWMEPYTRYYVFNIRFSNDANEDYLTLDKYSWFLYAGRRYDEALNINGMAHNAAIIKGDEDSAAFIEDHAKAIRERNWKHYD